MAIARGPVPNRREDLSRERDATRGDQIPIKEGTLTREPRQRKEYANREWSNDIKMLWDRILKSGMSEFYDDMDIMYLKILLNDLDNIRKNAYRGASQQYVAILGELGKFGITEADRRRMRIELHAPEKEDTTKAQLAMVTSLQEMARGGKKD